MTAVKSGLGGSTVVGVEGGGREDCRGAQPSPGLVLHYCEIVARVQLCYLLVPPEVIGSQATVLVEGECHSEGGDAQADDGVLDPGLEGVGPPNFVFLGLDVVDVQLALAAPRY